MKKMLKASQPVNNAVKDVNGSLVSKLRQKPQIRKDGIPDTIVGHSKQKKGYISLIPFFDKTLENQYFPQK